MIIKEIQEYADIRTKARAYFCYLLSRALHNRTNDISVESIEEAIKKIRKNLPKYEAFYVLDRQGKQITKNIGNNAKFKNKGLGKNRLDRAYYYRAVREKRCVLTNPYPSLLGNTMVVTASYPIYNEKGDLLYLVCLDVSLEHVLQMVHPSSIDSLFGKVSKIAYAAFSAALLLIAMFLFAKSMMGFISHGFDINTIDIKEMFEATILLTLSLAIFDLVKAIFEEEVLGHHKKDEPDDIHKTMVRFLGSIIIALAIESLMLVFKFAMIDPSKLINAVYIIGALSMLLIALSIYLRSIHANK